MSDALFQPIAWRLTAIGKPSAYATPGGNKPWHEDYAEQASAEARKRQLQGHGCIASVSPLYLDRRAREKLRRAGQSAPFGAFNAAWKLA